MQPTQQSARLISGVIHMKIKTIIFLFFISILSLSVSAAEKIDLKGPAPQGLLELIYDVYTTKEVIVNEGPHGMHRFCYKTDVYIVFSNNFFGDGYEISSKKPDLLNCFDINNSSVKTKNGLGMYIGMPKRNVLKLIGVEATDDDLILIWNSVKKIKDEEFYLQTYVEIQFINDKLDKLSVFTTETT